MIRPVLLAAAVFALAACASERPAPEAGMEAADPAANAPTTGPLPDESVYQLGAAWQTQAEDSTTLAAFRGRPALLAMVYANCGSACPLIVRDMKAMAAELPPSEAAGLRYVLVSLDPERDTPAAMRRFAEGHGLGPEWTLLRGTPTDVQMLANLLDVRYRPEPDGEITHSNVITVLDANGAIAAQHEGLGTDPSEAVAALEEALAANG